MFEGDQLDPSSKGCSFYKALFLLGKGANEISFIFTLSRGSIAGVLYLLYLRKEQHQQYPQIADVYHTGLLVLAVNLPKGGISKLERFP